MWYLYLDDTNCPYCSTPSHDSAACRESIFLGCPRGLKSRKNITSLLSGIHFGHYNAVTESAYISVHLGNLRPFHRHIGLYGDFPTRWQKGFSIILEKILGCRLPEDLGLVQLGMYSDDKLARVIGIVAKYHVGNSWWFMRVNCPDYR